MAKGLLAGEKNETVVGIVEVTRAITAPAKPQTGVTVQRNKEGAETATRVADSLHGYEQHHIRLINQLITSTLQKKTGSDFRRTLSSPTKPSSTLIDLILTSAFTETEIGYGYDLQVNPLFH